MRSFSISLLAALSLSVISPFARAADGVRAPERLAIGRIDWNGSIPEPLRRSLTMRLVDGLTAVSFEVLRPDRTGDGMGQAQDCREPGCWKGAARSLGVSYLVVAQVEEQEKSFAITLELISGRSGAVVGTNRERCEICGAEEVGEKMSLAAATLRARLESLAQAPARFVIRTRPHGATVRLDGKLLGQTPLDTNLAAGQHQVRIEHEGFSPLERTLAVTSGVDETVDLDLVRLPTKFPFRTAGWVAIGTGVALAAGGLYALSRDDDEVSCPASKQDGDGDCPRVYKTVALGASLLGASAVAGTLGGVWLFLAQPESGALLTNERAQLPRLMIGTSGRF